ncbi:MAG: RNA 2',3'-cyclic phosphodiesterase [Planctomycetes bacterium]|nr:RNA 2',3'-cyclic phosphodiesterase [Planctomycetota bacterium]
MDQRLNRPDAATLRCFVAVFLPAPVQEGLAPILAALVPPRGGGRAVAAARLHVTLRFLGDLDEAWVARVRDALRELPGRHPLRLHLDGLGRFPPRGAPRVVWAGLSGDAAGLVSLAERVEEAMTGLGLAPEAKAFVPHVTLLRVKDPRARLPDLEPLAARLERAPFVLERFGLYRSTLTPEGPVYAAIEEFPLAALDA